MGRKKSDAIAPATAAYKGFDKDLRCRGFQFEVGQTYTHEGPVKACESGFHACTDLWDVLKYYGFGGGNRFARVMLSGETAHEKGGDSKVAAGVITIGQELTFGQFIGELVTHTVNETAGKGDNPSGNDAQIGSSGHDARIGTSGHYARIGSSGNYARIGSSGHAARIGSSGHAAQIGSSGNAAQIGSSGNAAQIGSSGNDARIGTSGNYARIGTSGNYARIGSSGHAAQIGSSGHAAQIGSSGNYAQIGSSGHAAQIGSSGNYARIGSSGNDAQIGSSGNYARIELEGSDAVTAVAGLGAWVRASKAAWVSLASYDGNGKCQGFATGQLGSDGLKLDTWYRAENCKLVEAAIT